MKKTSILDFTQTSDQTVIPTPSSKLSFTLAESAIGRTADDQLEDQHEEIVNAEGGKSFITLNSGRRIQFNSVFIQSRKIEKYTAVHPFNQRNQDVVTESLCDDILPSVGKFGVKMPVMATRDADTKVYLIFDGSRRRFAALHTKQGLHIDFTDEALSDDEIAELSHISNLTKSSSLYDQGRYYQFRKEKLGISQNALADELGIPRSTMAYALSAYAIPAPVFNPFPSKTELGRSFTQKISKLIAGLEDDKLDALVEICKKEKPTATDAAGFARLSELAGQSATNPVEQVVAVGNIKYAAKGKKLTIEVPDNAVMDQLIELLNKSFA